MLEKIEIIVKQAQPLDLKRDEFNLRYGQCYFIKSLVTGKFDNKSYIIDTDTDPFQLKNWLDNKQLYVPVSDIWMEEHKEEIKKMELQHS